MVQHNVFDGNSGTASWETYAHQIIAQYNLKKISNEYHGACPNCGGKDRFWISNFQGDVKVNCRQCSDWKRIIDIMRSDGVYPEFNPPKNQTEPKVYDFPEVTQENDYLARKRIKQHSAIIDGPDLQIPIINNKGKRVGTQFIEPDGKKKFNYGLEYKGCFHVIGGPIKDFAYLCEGFATAASVHEATGKPAVHCLNASNITDVITSLREAKPEAQFLIAGDNDPAGIKAAERAFAEHGVESIFPKSEGLDWNDVWIARGPEHVKKELQPQSILDQVSFPDDVIVSTAANYIVKNWLSEDSMSIIYGASNVGKTFFVQDLCYHIAANKPWNGNKVRGGSVLYLQTEGGLSWQARIAALKQKHPDYKDVKFAIRAAPINMFNSEEDMNTIRALIAEISKKHGKVRVLVVDTISRATQGQLNESDNSEMAQFVANIDKLRQETGVHVIMVAHSGKDQSRGVRGASSLKAAADTEIELTHDQDNGVRTALTTKQRDMETGRTFNFILEAQNMGEDEDGDPITTCTVRAATDDEMHEAKKAQVKSGNQTTFKEVFYQLRGEGVGGPNPAGAGWPEPRKFWCIDEEAIKDHFKGRLVGATNPTQTYKQTANALLKNGIIAINEGKIWFTDKNGRVSDLFE